MHPVPLFSGCAGIRVTGCNSSGSPANWSSGCPRADAADLASRCRPAAGATPRHCVIPTETDCAAPARIDNRSVHPSAPGAIVGPALNDGRTAPPPPPRAFPRRPLDHQRARSLNHHRARTRCPTKHVAIHQGRLYLRSSRPTREPLQPYRCPGGVLHRRGLRTLPSRSASGRGDRSSSLTRVAGVSPSVPISTLIVDRPGRRVRALRGHQSPLVRPTYLPGCALLSSDQPGAS